MWLEQNGWHKVNEMCNHMEKKASHYYCIGYVWLAMLTKLEEYVAFKRV